MSPFLFGRAPTEAADGRFTWMCRGWLVEVYRADGHWLWRLQFEREGRRIVDLGSRVEHPTERAAVRSVSSEIRSIARTAAAITGGTAK